MILHKADLSEWVEQEWRNGPYSISEIVFFEEEWRYYVANGKIVAAHWYLGKEIEVDPPKLHPLQPGAMRSDGASGLKKHPLAEEAEDQLIDLRREMFEKERHDEAKGQ